MPDLFEIATRNKFRFSTPQGQVTAEDLWDLPLTSTRSNQANLDDIAMGLDKQLKESSGTVSFVRQSNPRNNELQTALDIVVHIIRVKQAEAQLAAIARENAAKKQRIMELIQNKQDEALASKSVEELNELLKAI